MAGAAADGAGEAAGAAGDPVGAGEAVVDGEGDATGATPLAAGDGARGTPRTLVGAACGVGDAVAGMVSRTELSRCFRTARAMLVIMKTAARPVVMRESRVTDPRGPKAAWVPPPPNALARSWPLPCWSRTTAIRKKHAIRCRIRMR